MNPNTTSDVIDEDAAVLQFPKGLSGLSHERQNHCSQKQCSMCTEQLVEPYIRCAECVNVEICPPCFARGAETHSHQNYHNYIVIHYEFPLFEENWTACEEEQLLNAILQCGYGNWEDVSRYVVTHSAEECKEHYVQTYVENPPTQELPYFKESVLSFHKEPIAAFRTSEVDAPPRYIPGTHSHNLLAGYNAARGDFDIEHDDEAELLLANLNLNSCPPSDPDFDLLSSLQVAVVQGYNQRLGERERRHTVIHDHGLIAMHKAVSWLNSFESTLTSATVEKLSFLMQILSGLELDYLYECLSSAHTMQKSIDNLVDLRTNGLTRLDCGLLYRQLKADREEYDRLRRPLYSLSSGDWQRNPLSTLPVVSSRRSAGPLEIFGLPGYDRLSPTEKELCKMVRIVPTSYLEFKHLLESECKKHGFLKLAQARSLIKIDVNKTRKLYDFLIQEGFVNSKPLSTCTED